MHSIAWLPFLRWSFVKCTIAAAPRLSQCVRRPFLADPCRTGSGTSEVIDEQDECGRYAHLKAPVAAGLSSGPQKRAEPSCLIYFKFKPRLNWKSWITLTPPVQDGLLRLKAAFSFLWLCLKKSYRNYFFWQTADPAAVDKKDKGRPALRHYKAGFYQRATTPATSNSPHQHNEPGWIFDQLSQV